MALIIISYGMIVDIEQDQAALCGASRQVFGAADGVLIGNW
jgi:hypothetical protein